MTQAVATEGWSDPKDFSLISIARLYRGSAFSNLPCKVVLYIKNVVLNLLLLYSDKLLIQKFFFDYRMNIFFKRKLTFEIDHGDFMLKSTKMIIKTTGVY